MRPMSRSDIETYLHRHGMTAAGTVAQILSGFDLGKPVYEQSFYCGDQLFQFVRNASRFDPSPSAGNWFALAGATTQSLAIIHGVAGRRLHKFGVSAPFIALEGTATRMAIDWNWSGGGPGGGTQIYVPPRLLGHLYAMGAHDCSEEGGRR